MESTQFVDKQMHFIMLLAPFQPVVRIELEAFINSSVECYLDIKNPTDKSLNVTVTKMPDAKRRITLNVDKLEIPKQSNSTMSIKWFPREAGCWRDILQFTDSRRIKYDIIIATTAKANKVKAQKRPLKTTLSKPSVLSGSIVNKRLHQGNALFNAPSNNSQFFLTDVNKQTRGDNSKNGSNKENILNKHHEIKICTLREEDKSTRSHNESTSVLSEQHSNVWRDGNALPQTFLASTVPQEIRRTTYVKESRHCHGNTTIYERSEKITEDVTYDRPDTNFSGFINDLKITTVSPQPAKKEFTASTNLSSVEDAQEEGNESLDVNHRTFEIPSISVPQFNVGLSPVPRPLGCCESPFKNYASSLIASSPIVHQSLNGVSKTEHSECFVDSIDYNRRVDDEYVSCATIPESTDVYGKTGNMYIEISPPRKHLFRPCSPLFTAKTGRVTKEKNFCNSRNVKGHHLFVPIAAKKSARKNVPAVKINKSTLCTLRQMKRAPSAAQVKRSRIEEVSIYEIFMPNSFTSSMKENPFFKNTANVFSEKWLSRQELVFTLWLNAVLSTPKDLRVNVDNAITDAIDKWQIPKCSNEDIDINGTAATLETTSTSCHTARKLQTLRRDAHAMFCRAEVMEMKSCIDNCITEGMLYIRADRNLHRNLGLQKDILNVFLCYNPLWLRVGLEAVYNEVIPLRNNNDLFGLTRFLRERFFTNPQLTKAPGYHKADPSKKFFKALNQFILKKFLLLVYFLDYAKQHKLIAHDPCLFRKQAAWKTSREILLRFSRDLIAGVGDVTKTLRTYDYELLHRQTYIDEYAYEVTDIRQDLRDGVRLCRVVELITGVDGLTRQCRAPAISLLQKVHNVEVALNALRRAGDVLVDDVEAKYVAYGDRTKTLSLLWQIVHKIQGPKFDQAARVIQRWWRSQVWYVRVRNYLYARREQAAVVIQRAWRLRRWKTEVTEERVYFLCAKQAAIHLQRWWRLVRESIHLKKHRELEEKRRRAVIVLQRKWRATLLMRIHRKRYRDLKNVVLTIQTFWRAKEVLKSRRAELLRAHEDAAARIQSWWRYNRLARKEREWFLRCRRSALVIQRTWRVYQARKQERLNACLRIQTWWRATSCRRRYRLQKASCVRLQRWWRECLHHLRQRRAALLIQSWYLALKAGRTAREDYLRMKNAAIRVQTWWRALLLAREERLRYQQLRQCAIILQTSWRRRVLARQDRQRFLAMKMACVTLQSYWRMVRARRCYQRSRSCVIKLQKRWRAVLAGRLVRREYEKTRECAIVLQTNWRAFAARRRFLRCRQAAIVIQSYYKMRITMRWYNNVKQAALIIQVYWRRYKRRKIEADALMQRKELALMVMDIQKECGASLDQEAIDKDFTIPSSDYWQQTIDILRSCNNVGALLTCLSSLDTITKLRPTICAILCQLNLVDEIYKTISQRNRSQPWMTVCQRACSILITLAKYSYTKKYIIKQEHALLLVKLLSDSLKDKEVFLNCATLLWLLSQDEDYSKAMAASFDINWLLRNIQQKVSKAMTIVKLQKSKKPEKLYASYEPVNQGNTLRFTDMGAAISAIINRFNT